MQEVEAAYNQRTIMVNKKDKSNIINIDAMNNACRKLSHCGLKLWLYFEQRKSGDVFLLSAVSARKLMGMSKPSYHRAFKELVDNSYLRAYKNDIYKFYEDENVEEYSAMPEISKDFMNAISDLNNKTGVYILWANDTIAYIGKSKNLKSRIQTSLNERYKMLDTINELSYIECKNIADTNIMEIMLITENKPLLNGESNCEDTSHKFDSGIDLYNLRRIKIFNK